MVSLSYRSSPFTRPAVAEAAAALGFPLLPYEIEIYADALVHLDASMQAAVQRMPAPPFTIPKNVSPNRDIHAATRTGSCFAKKIRREQTGRGSLNGLTAAVKDNIAVAGVPMTLGCPFLDNIIPERSATVVSRLRSAGARIVGTLTMDPFAVSGEGLGVGSPEIAVCANPWSPSHVTGGSSSGAAVAVARGLVDVALGTDQGGSVRLPVAWCGIVGFKATHGLIPTAGVVGLDGRIDHVAPLARTVQQVALAFEVLRKRLRGATLEADASSSRLAPPPSGIRIGVLVEGLEHEGADPGVIGVATDAIHTGKPVGTTLVSVSAPLHFACGRLLPCLITGGLWSTLTSADEFVRRRYGSRRLAEALVEGLRTRADQLPARVKMVLIFGRLAAARMFEYQHLAISQIRMYRAAYDRLFEEVDCLVMPTTSIPPPIRRPDLDSRVRLLLTLTRAHLGPLNINTAPYNMTGHPALTLPVGMHEGLPVGLSIIGPRDGDAIVLRVAAAFQSQLHGAEQAPAGLGSASTLRQ